MEAIYRTKSRQLPGTHWKQILEKARDQYQLIKKRSKRRPYVRSAYFNKEKIFLELFWHHLHEKANIRDKTRRLKFFPCAIELIQNSRFEPESNRNPNRRDEIWYRFAGITADDVRFFVQIKRRENNNQKWLMSMFPARE